MTEDMRAQFEQAVADVMKLSKAPDNMTKLALYALYKQGTKGDCEGKRPGMVDFVGRAKYDAWQKLAGTSQEDAMAQYIDLVRKLREADKG